VQTVVRNAKLLRVVLCRLVVEIDAPWAFFQNKKIKNKK
jgi:hypothetical protein